MASIGIIDLGIGNINSVQKALNALGIASIVSADPVQLTDVDKLILPGVGSFSAAAHALDRVGYRHQLTQLIKQKPLLGICVGMQILANIGEEHGENAGLELVPGRVKPVQTNLPLPHVGWNSVDYSVDSPLFVDIPTGSFFYFTHSFAFANSAEENCLATTEYGARFTSVVGAKSVWGVQFHPEKSQAIGLKLLRNFFEYCE